MTCGFAVLRVEPDSLFFINTSLMILFSAIILSWFAGGQGKESKLEEVSVVSVPFCIALRCSRLFLLSLTHSQAFSHSQALSYSQALSLTRKLSLTHSRALTHSWPFSLSCSLLLSSSCVFSHLHALSLLCSLLLSCALLLSHFVLYLVVSVLFTVSFLTSFNLI